MKHGIFSQVVLLEGEPRAEFNSLLCKLRDDLEPEGALEEVLVDKLAVLLWRQRRLIIAEGAEIRKGTEFLEWDEKRQRDDEEANITVCDVKYCGLVRKIANPKVLDRCLNLLDKLDEEIEMYGFEEEENKIILGQLYGDPESKLWVERTLFDAYSDLLNLARFNPSSGEQSKVLSPEHCKNIFLHCLKEEIKRLDRYKREHALTESHRMKVESLRGNVPDAPQVDRLLRCETNLGRRFDRTLSQLERRQRMRKGQS